MKPLFKLPNDLFYADQTFAGYIKKNQEKEEFENGASAIEDFERKVQDYEDRMLFEREND